MLSRKRIRGAGEIKRGRGFNENENKNKNVVNLDITEYRGVGWGGEGRGREVGVGSWEGGLGGRKVEMYGCRDWKMKKLIQRISHYK